MKKVKLCAVSELRPADLIQIVDRLTRPASEFQSECAAALNGHYSATPIAVWLNSGTAHGWACSHVWNGQQTLEMFVDPARRGAGIASALSSFLIAAAVIDPEKTLAVFSPVTARIANRLGCVEVLQYARAGDGWSLMP